MTDFSKAPHSVINTISAYALGDLLGNHGKSQSRFISAVWPNANRAAFIPFFLTIPVTTYKMVWRNGTVVSGNLDVGVYDENFVLLAHSGSTAQTGTSADQSVTISLDLNPGTYFMAMCVDNATGTFFQLAAASQVEAAIGHLQQNVGSVTLPATATAVQATGAVNIPYLSLTLRSEI